MRIFSEIQRFNQWWMWLVYISMLVFMAYTTYERFVAHGAVGNVSHTDAIVQFGVLIIMSLVLLLFFLLKLETKIDESGIQYQFIPFHFSQRTIYWNEIKECHVRKYGPIREFGGWGYRVSIGNGKAYNVKGNKGIQIILKNGRKILIGTQKQTEAQEVINRYFDKNERV